MPPRLCPNPPAPGGVRRLLPVALGCALSALPLQAAEITGATPTLVRTVPPEAMPNPALEAALRAELFPVPDDDGHGHGPDPGSTEAELAKRHRIRAECERLPGHRYIWSRVDLSGDGRPELVVRVLGPTLCGSGGCALLIYREPSPGRLQLVTRMTLFQEPLIVAEGRHNGWKPLISRVRLDAGSSTYAELRYDGRTYPTNPSVAPAIPLRGPVAGTAYLAWNDRDPRAHVLPCQQSRAVEQPLPLSGAAVRRTIHRLRQSSGVGRCNPVSVSEQIQDRLAKAVNPRR